jgi:hypothetical protein
MDASMTQGKVHYDPNCGWYLLSFYDHNVETITKMIFSFIIYKASCGKT